MRICVTPLKDASYEEDMAWKKRIKGWKKEIKGKKI